MAARVAWAAWTAYQKGSGGCGKSSWKSPSQLSGRGDGQVHEIRLRGSSNGDAQPHSES